MGEVNRKFDERSLAENINVFMANETKSDQVLCAFFESASETSNELLVEENNHRDSTVTQLPWQLNECYFRLAKS